MEIEKYLKPDHFLLFLAPPAWGKTSMILELYERSDLSFVFISPLRALAQEVYSKIKRLPGVLVDQEVKQAQKSWYQKKFFLVSTVESFPEDYLSAFEREKTLFIFDEFHLFYYWGESFRPHLKEFQYLIGAEGFATLALSATFSSQNIQLWVEEYFGRYNNLFVCNHGNYHFKNPAKEKYYFFLWGKKLVNFLFTRELKKHRGQTLLLFCQYRKEVDYWYDYCQRHKVRAVACVGGEVSRFLEQVHNCPRPDCIISTTVLSHGVNLPEISKVYVNYPVKNHSFWLQMTSRAGRRGGEFSIYSCDGFSLDLKQKLQNIFHNFRVLANYFLIRNFGVW